MLGKGIVARIMSRHSHDGTCSVTSQYIFSNPDRNLLISERINGIGTREHTGYLMIHLTITFGTFLHIVEILVNLSFLFGCRQFSHQL